MAALTRQEMFDRAVRGLRAQGWERCSDGQRCVYSNEYGLRCAWGHVDPSLTQYDAGSVEALRHFHKGIATDLSAEDCEWAMDLQAQHDNSGGRVDMQDRFRTFGTRYGLTWPEEKTDEEVQR